MSVSTPSTSALSGNLLRPSLLLTYNLIHIGAEYGAEIPSGCFAAVVVPCRDSGAHLGQLQSNEHGAAQLCFSQVSLAAGGSIQPSGRRPGMESDAINCFLSLIE